MQPIEHVTNMYKQPSLYSCTRRIHIQFSVSRVARSSNGITVTPASYVLKWIYFSLQLTIGLCFSSQGSPNIIFRLPSADTRNHSVMFLPFMSKVIKHFSFISPSILSVPSTFRTLIGLIGCRFHL